MDRRTCIFSGDVQGVGFRYTAQNVAARHNVQGYVRNLPDGRVELVMEGPDGEMDRMLEDLKERMEGFIRKVQVHTAPATEEFGGFSIRH